MGKRYNRIKRLVKEERALPSEGISFSHGWRKKILREFGEWAPIETSGPTNGTSTTFGYFSGGSPVINGETGQQVTFTYSGLNGAENYPTSVTIDQGFGDTFQTAPPPFSQIGVQGYTAKLNPRYAEAQKKYEEEMKEWERKKEQQQKDIEATLKSFGTSFKELRSSKYWIKKLGDGTFVAIQPTVARPDVLNWTHNVRIIKLKQAANADPMYIDYNPREVDPSNGKRFAYMARNVEIQNDVYLNIGQPPKAPIEQEYLIPRRTDFKDVNPQLDASQEFAQQVGADELMNARVKDVPEQPSFSKIANNTSMLPTFDGVPRHNPLSIAPGGKGFPFSDAIGNTLRYTTGNYDPKVPVKGGQSGALEASMLNTMSNAINSGTLSQDPARPGFFKVGVYYDGIPKPGRPEGTEFSRDDWEGDGSLSNNRLTNASAQGLLQVYSFKPTKKKGVIVRDRFNLDGSTFGGAAAAIPGGQQLIDFLVRKGDAKIRQRGGNPKDDATAGFDLEYTIPWERIPNDHPLRGNVKESITWNRLQKYR